MLAFSIISDELRDESSIPTPADLGTSTPPSVASIHERWLCSARASSLTLRFSRISSSSSVIECSIGSSTPMVTRCAEPQTRGNGAGERTALRVVSSGDANSPLGMRLRRHIARPEIMARCGNQREAVAQAGSPQPGPSDMRGVSNIESRARRQRTWSGGILASSSADSGVDSARNSADNAARVAYVFCIPFFAESVATAHMSSLP
ncbi:hypothetical protein TcBrA4_0070280 [Trypanosoma cruzi]|nr:hypothetical protein TcBrA4_0070280 [Trypanosoma cruzi]